MSDWNEGVIEEFRVNGGRIAAFGDADMVILHHTGAKSGKERETPLVSQVDGERVVVFASKAGAPTHPDWYHNLVANPRARIEIGTDSYDVTARVAAGEERERLWARQKELMPGFAEYEKTAGDRQIPVVVLERAGS
jgi:deazaflavin-dependent oxidoreductase (nitroreductase family)